MFYKRLVEPSAQYLLTTEQGKEFRTSILKPLGDKMQRFQEWRYSSVFVQASAVLAVAVFLIVDSSASRQRLISACGIVVLVLFGYIISKHPEYIRWRQVFWGIGLQFLFGLIVLRSSTGRQLFSCLGDKVT